MLERQMRMSEHGNQGTLVISLRAQSTSQMLKLDPLNWEASR